MASSNQPRLRGQAASYKRRKLSRQKRSRHLTIEPLAARHLLAGDLTLTGSDLTLTGSELASAADGDQVLVASSSSSSAPADSTAALVLDLVPSSDTGASDSDNITADDTPSFIVSGTTVGASVSLMVGGTTLATVTADDTTTAFDDVDLSGFADGVLSIEVEQNDGGTLSSLDTPLAFTLDRQSPTISNPVDTQEVRARRDWTLYLKNSVDENGLRYSLISAPTGMTLDQTTGFMQWTPTAADVGTTQVTVQYVDVAGNATDSTFAIEVGTAPLAYFEFSMPSQAFVGQPFWVDINVVDFRVASTRHVFSAYLDVLFDSSVASLNTANSYYYGPNFENVKSGEVLSDRVDELGGVSSYFGQRSQHLASIQFVANELGTFTIAGAPADGIGHEVLMVDDAQPISPSDIDFGTLSIDVVRPPYPVQIIPGSSIVASATHDNVSNFAMKTMADGLLDVWADFNHDGDFTDAGEHIVNDLDTSNWPFLGMLTFTVPAGTATGTLPLRYGITSDGVLDPIDGDESLTLTVLDEASGNDTYARVSSDNVAVSSTTDGLVIVQASDGTTLFSAGGTTSFVLRSSASQPTIKLQDVSSAGLSTSNLKLLTAGQGTLQVDGFAQMIDMTGDVQMLEGFDAIQIMDSSVLALDEAGITLLESTDRRLALSVPGVDQLQLSGQWTVSSTSSTAAGFERELASAAGTISLIGGDAWTNPIDLNDVNGSGNVSPLDALIILNELSAPQYSDAVTRVLFDPATIATFPGLFFDVSGDGLVTPLDALRVINVLTISSLNGESAARAGSALASPAASSVTSSDASAAFASPWSLADVGYINNEDDDDDEDDSNDLQTEQSLSELMNSKTNAARSA